MVRYADGRERSRPEPVPVTRMCICGYAIVSVQKLYHFESAGSFFTEAGIGDVCRDNPDEHGIAASGENLKRRMNVRKM